MKGEHSCTNATKNTKKWWAREDSNLQPDRYERSALTIELRARCGGAKKLRRPLATVPIQRRALSGNRGAKPKRTTRPACRKPSYKEPSDCVCRRRIPSHWPNQATASRTAFHRRESPTQLW